MIYGIKSNGKEIHCAKCNQLVSKDGELKFNFCPKCGNPLNMKSSTLYEKECNHDKIVMLYELLDTIKEGNDAEKTINEFIEELKDN